MLFRKIQKKKLSQRVADAFKNSVIIYYLTKFSGYIYHLFMTGIFGTVMTSYEAITNAFASSSMAKAFRAFLNNKGVMAIRNVKRAMAKAYERSIILTKIRGISYHLLITNVSSLGLFLFSFGFFTLLIQILKEYAFHIATIDSIPTILGLVIMVIAVFMFFSKKNIAETVYDSVILHAILFDYLGLRIIGVAKAAKTEARKGFNIAFGLGMAFGAFSIVAEPLRIVILLVFILLISIVLSAPEAGILLVLLCLPFMPTKYLIASIGLILISYFLKLICGRRVLRFSLVDYTVTAFLAFTVFGGIISIDSSSFEKMLVYVCFMLGYFVVKNTISSPSLVRRCLYSLITSSTVVSLYGLYENFFGSASTVWQDVTVFSEISGRVVSTFENPNVLGEYLILIFPVTLSMMLVAKRANERFALFFAAGVNALCLVFTWSRGAWLGFILAVVLFFLLSSKHFLTAGILLSPLAVLGLSFMIDTSVIRRFTTFTDSSTSYRLSIWRGTLDMLKDTWWYGIGIGEGAFRAVYPAYALPGIETAPHSHNLYLQIITETGAISLISFLLFVIILAQCVLTFSKNAVSRPNKTIAIGLLCGIIAFLIQGMTDYVWYNYRIFLLFWLLAGLTIAHILAAKQTVEESIPIYY